jgi:hypothetical protein
MLGENGSRSAGATRHIELKCLTGRPPTPTEKAETRMNAGSQALLIGNALKKPCELVTFLIGQGGTERFVMLVANPADVTQGGLSFGR